MFQTFADLSAQALMCALTGEIKADGSLVFNGPPYTQLSRPGQGAAATLGLDGFNKLRAAAAWAYENSAEVSQRHGLFVAEFARTHPPQTDAATAFASILGNVLQGARLAYQLSLSEMTREAIKAQGDLRKAVADDMAKLVDNTRQVVTALTAALATGIGLVAARIATTTPAWVLEAVSWIAACYVATIIVSGWLFMTGQRDMRNKWRHRLYRFIPDSDYKAMVTDPAGRAERMFIVTATVGGLCVILEVVLVSYVH